jgi:hypothetical protein
MVFFILSNYIFHGTGFIRQKYSFLTNGQKQSRCKGYKNPRGGKYSRRVSRFFNGFDGF